MKKLKKVGNISVDGSKVKANASKHKAVSYKRAGEIIAELELEVQLVRLAEEADGKVLEEGLKIPEEIQRREERKAVLERGVKARSPVSASNAIPSKVLTGRMHLFGNFAF